MLFFSGSDQSPHFCDRQIVGMVAGIERTMMDAEQLSNAEFMISVLDKQHQRLKALFERHVVSLAS